MGIITRSEAAHRLKMISSMINCAVRATQDGHWKDASDAASSAQDLLDKLAPHLEEAAGVEGSLVGSLQYGTPPPVQRAGGLGYRGSSHREEPAQKFMSQDEIDEAQRAVREGRKKQQVPKAIPIPEPIKRPIVTPPPPIARKPIITPPPAPPKLAPEPQPDSMTFDLARMSGREEYMSATLAAVKSGVTPPPLTDDEWKATEMFDTFTSELRAKIVRIYKETGKPVVVRLRKD